MDLSLGEKVLGGLSFELGAVPSGHLAQEVSVSQGRAKRRTRHASAAATSPDAAVLVSRQDLLMMMALKVVSGVDVVVADLVRDLHAAIVAL